MYGHLVGVKLYTPDSMQVFGDGAETPLPDGAKKAEPREERTRCDLCGKPVYRPIPDIYAWKFQRQDFWRARGEDKTRYAIFCSYNCMRDGEKLAEAYKKKRRASARKWPRLKCPVCGQMFPSRNGAKYCTRACYLTAVQTDAPKRERKPKPEPVDLTLSKDFPWSAVV